MTAEALVALVSELFAGLGFLLSVFMVGLLAYKGVSIPATLMLVVGVAAGAFYSLKGASGTVAALRAIHATGQAE